MYTILFSPHETGKDKNQHGFSRQKMLDMSVIHKNMKGAHKINKILALLTPFSDASFNMQTELSLNQSAELIRKCELIVTNDSAPLHLVNAVQTDVIAIFCPTVKSLGFYPFRSGDTIVEIDLPCRPCGTHGSNRCPKTHFKCMENIFPEWS